jgi:hypothetical protein
LVVSDVLFKSGCGVTLVVVVAVVVVGVSVWVALSEYEVWLRRSLAGAVA